MTKSQLKVLLQNLLQQHVQNNPQQDVRVEVQSVTNLQFMVSVKAHPTVPKRYYVVQVKEQI